MVVCPLFMANKKKVGPKKRPQLSARVEETLLVRLGIYIAKNRGIAQQDVVADAVDEYLKKRGA